jgi:E3 ubiquitin-protein ligase UBR4
MSVLAAIVRDLDFETYHPDSKSSTDEHVSDNSLAALYEEFSGSVASFNHNLMAYKLLTTKLQDSLLSHLMVSPEDERDWPLRVFPRTLSLLAHILLLRQNAAEKGGLYLPPKNNIYVILWEKVLSTLTKHIFNPPSSSCPESEDLNVEHVQLLLFFFHALALMQKKQVLLLAANNIIKTSKLLQSCVNSGEDLKISQIYHFSRLILLFEYMMKCLYEPPKTLMDQVQQNIFKKHLKQQTAESTSSAPAAGLAYHSFREIEDNMIRLCKTGSGPLPRFYNLYAHSDMLFASANEVPKLDGLAISFILGTADTLHYGQLYEALINSLQVVHQTGTRREKNQQFENLSATQYCFSVTWRLLQSLPPSIEYLEDLVTEGEDIDEKEEEESIELHALLHKLMLSSRLGQKVFVTWIKDALVKQGQTTAKAEAHLKKATTYVGSFAFDFRQLKRLLKSFISKKFVVAKRGSLLPGQDMPKFFDILLLDAIMAKVHISFDKIFVVKTPTLASASAAVTPDTEDAPFDHAGVDAVQVK